MAARVALVVGNSVYEDATLARLRTPEADVRALASVLRDDAIGGFDEVVTLTDEEEPIVRRAIFRFFQKRSRDDLVLFYFSGHGVKDDSGRLFLAMRDTSYEQLKATAIATAYITECMDECRSRRQILILDCCNSGAFAHGTKGDRSAMSRATFEGNGYGRVVLTASDSTQYALEGDGILEQADHSLFTHFLLEGLTTGCAARPGESTITLDDWYDYAYAQVVDRTPSQTPRKWVYNQDGELVIARTTSPPPLPPAALSAELGSSLEDPRTWVREGAVRELERITAGGDAALRQTATDALTRIATEDDSLRVRSAAEMALRDMAAGESPSSERSDDGGSDRSRPDTVAVKRSTSEIRVAMSDSPGPQTEVASTAAVSEQRTARASLVWLYWSAACGVLAGSMVYAVGSWANLSPVYWFGDVLQYTPVFIAMAMAARLTDRLAARLFSAAVGWTVGLIASWLFLFLLG